MDYEDQLEEAKKALLKKILDDLGIELAVSGCGCCGSPLFTFKYLGQTIFEEQESMGFSNVKDDKRT